MCLHFPTVTETAVATTPDLDALRQLPPTFRYRDARAVMNERRFRNLLTHRAVIRLSRGLYRKATAPNGDEDLIVIAGNRPQATLCLRSALARHDLIDDIPAELDIAFPRGTRVPTVTMPVSWHHFDAATFDLGRTTLPLDISTSIGLYSPERSIIDAFRLRHIEGPELGIEALRRWLRAGGQPSALLRTAASFRSGTPALRRALEVLL